MQNTDISKRTVSAELDSFLSTALQHRKPISLATILAAKLGQREAGILMLCWEDVVSDVVKFRQTQGGAVVQVPLSDRLSDALATVPRDADDVIIPETTGRT
jgi:xanthine/CO dehydrogenase XdhC/CoxF family maturation factor